MKKLKVILFALLGILLVFLLASCNKDKDAGPDLTGADPYGRYEQTLKMTTAKVDNAAPNLPAGMTMDANPFYDILMEKLNIELSVSWFSATYSQALALSIMTGDVTDMINILDYLTYKQLVANDLVQPLDGLIEAYGTEYIKNTYKTYGDDYFDFTTVNGHLMAIPGNNGGYQQNLLWVRKDWLDALNLSPPQTLDEIINVAQQFMQKDPGGNGRGNTIGINANREHSFIGVANQFGLETICYLYGAYPGAWMEAADGSIYYGSVQPEMKQALARIKSMYEVGVLDMDAFTYDHSFEDIRMNVYEGRCGLWFTGWGFGYNNPDFYGYAPNAELICYPAPLDSSGNFTYVDGNTVRSWYAVRKGFSNPEALIKIMNVCFDAWLGFNQEDFERVASMRASGGNWTSAIPTGDFNIVQYDIIPVLGQATKNFIDNGIMDETLIPSDKYMVQQSAAWADGSSTEKGDWMVWLSRYIGSPETRTGIEKILKPAFHYTTDTMEDKWTMLYETMEREMYRLILSGEEPIDYFDEFVTQWYEAGGRTITDEVNQVVRESRG